MKATYKKGTLKQQILQMRNYPKQLQYEYFAGKAGLFDKAFFGHKATNSEKAKLKYILKCIDLYN